MVALSLAGIRRRAMTTLPLDTCHTFLAVRYLSRYAVKRMRGALASLLAVIVTVCDGKASSAGATGGGTASVTDGTLALCGGAGRAGGGACSWAWPSDTTHNHPAQAIHVRMHFFQ